MTSSMRGGRPRKFKSEINVVPYIDVMLVLLVIFMVVAPLTNPGVINLPSAEKSALPPSEYIQVSLKPNAFASIGINGKKDVAPDAESMPSRSALMQKLQSMHEQYPDMPVMISADKEIKYDEVIQVISQAKKFGVNRVGLATRQ